MNANPEEQSPDQLQQALQARLSPAAWREIAPAWAWARSAHQGRLRGDGSSLWEHVTGVVANLLAARADSPDILVAGLLHDAVEAGVAELREIEMRYGRCVAGLVAAVTRLPGETAEESVARATAAGPEALLLRLCDRWEGVRRSSGRTSARRRALLEETRRAHLPAAEAAFPHVAAELRRALESAEVDLNAGADSPP